VSVKHIILIGAGIGGLTAALGLKRAGFRVSIYEQAPELGEVGAGLTLSPNATHALESLGLADKLSKAASTPIQGSVRHHKTSETLLRNDRGKLKSQFGAGYYQIHRADLHAILVAAVKAYDPDCIHLNKTFESVTDINERPCAHFSDGSEARGDALIGCDGVRSSVRGALFTTEPPKFTGQVAWRGIVPVDRLPANAVLTDSTMITGPGRTLTYYYIRNRTQLNYVAIVKKSGWEVEGWTVRSTIPELLAEYEDWHPDFRAIIEQTPPELCFKWALFDRDPLDCWVEGNAALLGDAAHPMLPFLGQGAAQAIEDGVLLGRSLSQSSDVSSGLALYQSARKARANNILLWSRYRGRVLQGQKLEPHEDGDLKTSANDDVIFGYNPVTAPLPA